VTAPPLSQREAIALFRLGVIGDLLSVELAPGELQQELQHRAKKRYRPPGASASRTYHWKTLQRWLHAARCGSSALTPASRARGFARALDAEVRQTLLDIRREHPTAAAEMILGEVLRHGLLAPGQLSVSTLRRLFRDHDLPRASKNRADRSKTRRRWEADRPAALWHGDVCHLRLRRPDGSTWPARVHGFLDDHSRFMIALAAHATEKEEDMLRVLVGALLQHTAPTVLYLDNGSCYRGQVLTAACLRLGIRLVHAKPYDPRARGKMERVWRTMRQQCTDHLGPVSTLAEVNAALWAWRDAYQHRAHAGLMGETPWRRYRGGLRGLPAPKTAAEIARALEEEHTRRVRGDGTVSLHNQRYEVGGRHLVNKTLTVVMDPLTRTPVRALYQGRPVPIGRCDPRANAKRGRATPAPVASQIDLPFDPIAALLSSARKEKRDE